MFSRLRNRSDRGTIAGWKAAGNGAGYLVDKQLDDVRPIQRSSIVKNGLPVPVPLQRLTDGLTEARVVAERYQQPVDARSHHLGHATDAGGNHRNAAGERLEQDVRPSLRLRQEYE